MHSGRYADDRAGALPLAVGGAARGDALTSKYANRDEMKKLLSDLGAALASIWITPEEAREILRQRDITFEIRDARGAYAKAA